MKSQLPKPKEKEIQSMILRYLNLNGHFCWKASNVGIWDQKANSYRKAPVPGIADIIGIAKDGMMIAIECKRPGNDATTAQKAFLGQVSKRGGYAIVAESVDDCMEVGL